MLNISSNNSFYFVKSLKLIFLIKILKQNLVERTISSLVINSKGCVSKLCIVCFINYYVPTYIMFIFPKLI